jgi:hypothetical protein
MILNSYAVLLSFVALLRLLAGVAVLVAGAAAWRARSRPTTPEGRDKAEDRTYLVFLLALLLVGLNLVSWPLLYLLLQSYVPEWPGVMCVYGVTQVGKGSLGTSRFLPDLLRFLELTKPALVFAGGAWFVLYALNRQTRTAPLSHQLFIVLLPLGAVAAADAAAELSYVAIPKKEVFVEGGCCTAAEDSAARFLPPILVGDAGRPWLYGAFYGANLGLALALFVLTRRSHAAPGSIRLGLLLLGGVLALAVSGLFLVEVAAPALLHLPYHHCAYDLIPRVPEAVAAIVVYLAGCFSLGWAGVARGLGTCKETEPLVPRAVGQLLRFSLWGYLASVAMLSVELALA